MGKENESISKTIADKILKQCALSDEYKKLLASKQTASEQIAQLQNRSELYNKEINTFTEQISGRRNLIDQALISGEDPEVFTQEIRKLETAILDRKEWIGKTEAHILEIRLRDKEIKKNIRDIIHLSIQACRAEILSELNGDLSKIVSKQIAFFDACQRVKKSVDGLPELSPRLCQITFNQGQHGIVIQ